MALSWGAAAGVGLPGGARGAVPEGPEVRSNGVHLRARAVVGGVGGSLLCVGSVGVPTGRGRQEKVLGHVPECLWASVAWLPVCAWGLWRFGVIFLLCVERSLWWAMWSFRYPVWGGISVGHLWDLNGWPRQVFGELQGAVDCMNRK